MNLTSPCFGEAEDFPDVLQSETLVVKHVENLLLDRRQQVNAVPDLLVQFPLEKLFGRALLIEIDQLSGRNLVTRQKRGLRRALKNNASESVEQLAIFRMSYKFNSIYLKSKANFLKRSAFG